MPRRMRRRGVPHSLVCVHMRWPVLLCALLPAVALTACCAQLIVAVREALVVMRVWG